MVLNYQRAYLGMFTLLLHFDMPHLVRPRSACMKESHVLAVPQPAASLQQLYHW